LLARRCCRARRGDLDGGHLRRVLRGTRLRDATGLVSSDSKASSSSALRLTPL
jgi:hypothetical protein